MNVDCLVGEIRIFAGSFCPEGWAYCNGQQLQVAAYPELFSLISNTYGGDGRSSFALPDYRGRLVAGQGDGPGLTGRALAQTFGSETVTLLEAQIPRHNHPFSATTTIADLDSPVDAILANPGTNAVMYEAEGTADQLKPLYSDAVKTAGNNYPHNNMMPFAVLSYIIALRGTYPQRG